MPIARAPEDAFAHVRHVLMATDLTAGTPVAFAHALKLALRPGGLLSVLHVAKGAEPTDWQALPTVRATLEAWGVVKPGASLDDFERLGVRVRMATAHGDAVGEVVRKADHHPYEVLVLSPHHRTALERWTRPEVSGAMMRQAHLPTLFLPDGCKPLVDVKTGVVTCKRIIVPLASEADQEVAERAAVAFARALGVPVARGTFVFVGPVERTPAFDLSERSGWQWDVEVRPGDVVENVLRAAHDLQADAILTVTKGHDSLGDAILGSHTDQLAHRASCPVVAVPV